MRFCYLVLFFLMLGIQNPINAQRKSKEKISEEKTESSSTPPKLVVGIVVDQMRYDYLTRFWGHYGEGGFKRLINSGFNCKNNHFNYAPTSTGPGHASVYTGTTPATHGIIGNDWYDKETNKKVYCAGDDRFASVGTASNAGQMSPHRMNVTTITDQLRLHTQMRGKTIAISLKDRGAVFPGGHTANGAYWFHGETEGRWITSSFYMSNLPKWVADFNGSNKVEQYKKPWTTLRDINTYVESGLDNTAYEGLFKGETVSVFPHDIPKLWEENGHFDILKDTPFGNTMVVDFALAALTGESLGTDSVTDFLAISFSSTDYIGHKFGVNSKEVQDTYLRLDQDLDLLLKALDKQVGLGEYIVFLTADHAAIEVPTYLRDQKVPAGYSRPRDWMGKLNEFLNFTYGTTDLVKNSSNEQLFLDDKLVKNLGLEIRVVQEAIALELLSYDAIDKVYTGYQMWQNSYEQGIANIIQNGYNQKRSGDVLWVLKPGFIDYGVTGSTHGSPQVYDTHVPLLFYGKGIPAGQTARKTVISDIAPTLAVLLGISYPNGNIGEPIIEVLD